MEIEVAREYYALTEVQKSIRIKKKRLLSEIHTFDRQYNREDKRAKRIDLQMAMNSCEKDERQGYMAMAELKNKYEWHGVPSIAQYRNTLKKKVDKIYAELVIHKQWCRRQFPYSIKNDKYAIKKEAKAEKLRAELYNLPHARPLFVVPAITLPLLFNPTREKLVLETGSLNADIWHFLLSSHFLVDRPTLRAMRLSCVSMAILVHGMLPEITGYFFCV